MTMRITMLQARLGESGAVLAAGSTNPVSDAFGALMVGQGYATDTDGALTPPASTPNVVARGGQLFQVGVSGDGGLLPVDPAAARSALLVKMPKFAKAIARVRAGIADAKVFVIADSTGEGMDTSTAATYPERSAWPARTAAILSQRGLAAASGFACPAAAVPIVNPDNRWTLGTGWAPTRNYGLAGGECCIRGTSPAGNLVFADPSVNCDSYDVYYLTVPGTGDLTLTATGGTPVVQSTSAANGVGKVTVAAAALSLSNTLTISATGNTFIVGIEPFSAAVKRVRIGNVGAGGSKAAQWVTVPATGLGTQQVLQAYAPDLTIIGPIGLNSANAVDSVSGWIGNLKTLRDWAAVSGDVAFATWAPGGGVTAPYEPPLIAALRAEFGADHLIFDFYARAGTYAAYNALGFMAGALHPSDLGHWDQGGLVANIINAL